MCWLSQAAKSSVLCPMYFFKQLTSKARPKDWMADCKLRWTDLILRTLGMEDLDNFLLRVARHSIVLVIICLMSLMLCWRYLMYQKLWVWWTRIYCTRDYKYDEHEFIVSKIINILYRYWLEVKVRALHQRFPLTRFFLKSCLLLTCLYIIVAVSINILKKV